MSSRKEFYYLSHSYEIAGDISETKFIGIFSDREKAEEAVRLLQRKPGFEKYPEGFSIDIVTIDRIGWEDGFFNSEEED